MDDPLSFEQCVDEQQMISGAFDVFEEDQQSQLDELYSPDGIPVDDWVLKPEQSQTALDFLHFMASRGFPRPDAETPVGAGYLVGAVNRSPLGPRFKSIAELEAYPRKSLLGGRWVAGEQYFGDEQIREQPIGVSFIGPAGSHSAPLLICENGAFRALNSTDDLVDTPEVENLFDSGQPTSWTWGGRKFNYGVPTFGLPFRFLLNEKNSRERQRNPDSRPAAPPWQTFLAQTSLKATLVKVAASKTS